MMPENGEGQMTLLDDDVDVADEKQRSSLFSGALMMAEREERQAGFGGQFSVRRSFHQCGT